MGRWVGGWQEEGGGCLCPTVSPTATSDELKILSVCHTHVSIVPHAEKAPLHSSCSGAEHLQRYCKKLKYIHRSTDI